MSKKKIELEEVTRNEKKRPQEERDNRLLGLFDLVG